jgi:hypothetical protein
MKLLIVCGLLGVALFFYLHSRAALWHSHQVVIDDTKHYSINYEVYKAKEESISVDYLLLPKTHSKSENNQITFNESTIDVVRDFGAKGNGIADDTQAIQNAIDAVYQNGGGTIVFPPGTYLVRSVTLKENITYYGYGATIKRPPLQDKWTRTFTTHYAGTVDSQPLILKGFTFDGNQAQQGTYQNYELEQAHLLFLMGDAHFPGRLKVVVEDCVFKNGVADGISVYTNVDIRVNQSEAIDVFRGGFVLTGGNSTAEVSNFSTRGSIHPTGIDVEVDGKGYGDTLRTDIKLENINLMNGDFDIGVAEGSTVVGKNIFSEAPFHLYSLDSTMHFADSTFKVGAADGYINRILFPHHLTFENCNFIVTRQVSAEAYQFFAAVDVWWQHPSQPLQQNQKLIFQNCSFDIDSSIRSTDLTYAIYLRPDAEINNNQLIVEGADISEQFNTQILQEPL